MKDEKGKVKDEKNREGSPESAPILVTNNLFKVL
jgi:hypothetical protein